MKMKVYLACTLALACAALAMPTFAHALDEGEVNLESIASGAADYAKRGDYKDHEPGDPDPKPRGHFPIVASEVCTSTGGTGERTPPVAADYKASPWNELMFTINKPHTFRYCYQSDGKTFSATATDGSTKYQAKGTIEDKDGVQTPVVSLVEEVSE